METSQNNNAEKAGNVPVSKEWANPTPAGLVALAAACACFFALLTGRVSASAMPLIGCWLLGGFVIQIVVALLDLKSGNLAGGNTFLFFSAFFMLVSGLEMLLRSGNVVEIQRHSSGNAAGRKNRRLCMVGTDHCGLVVDTCLFRQIQSIIGNCNFA